MFQCLIVQQIISIKSSNNFLILVGIYSFCFLNYNFLSYLGWRYTKTYFLATKTGTPKDERYLLSWVYISNSKHFSLILFFQCHYGLDKAFGEKDITNCLKLLKSVSVSTKSI